MTTRLAERLSAARRKRFVGRAVEKQLYQAIIATPEPQFSLLYLYGPGGVGKTSLLRELVSITPIDQAEAIYLDGRNIEATPDAFLSSLATVLASKANQPLAENPFVYLINRSQQTILFVDTYESLAALDTWLRDTFLPQMPANSLVVLAGRTPPSATWRSDPGWQSLVKVWSLRNLTPEESRDYLDLRTVPSDVHEKILSFTHGHPLAISLVADLLDQQPNLQWNAAITTDVVHALIEQLMRDAPTRNHRLALEACALVRYMTEGLLNELLAVEDAHEYFEWMRGLSFIDTGRLGLYPHDLVRDAISADLRWRNPDQYNQLHQRARSYYHRRLRETQGQTQRRILTDLVFLHRDNAVVRPFYEWQDNESLWTDRATAEDWPAIVEMVRQHEGGESAKCAEAWLRHPKSNPFVVRDRTHQAIGFVLMLTLQDNLLEADLPDPAVRAAWNYLQQTAPIRPNEFATYFRFWMDKENYQGVSPTQSRIFLACVQHYLSTPGLAYSLFPCANPDFFAGVFAYADLQRIEQADFTVGEQRYGLYGHDWRLCPPAAWLELLAEREVAMIAATESAAPVARPAPAPSIVLLSQPEFANAIREALKHFTNPTELQRNPLLRSKVLTEFAGNQAVNGTRVAQLQALLKASAEPLQSSPKQNKLYRALHHTYFQPAATQELAAEMLDLPFSTYRRHLKEGIDSVVESLWHRELQSG